MKRLLYKYESCRSDPMIVEYLLRNIALNNQAN